MRYSLITYLLTYLLTHSGDLMWLASSNVLGDLPLPELPVVRSNVCLPKLLEFIEKSSKSNDPPKRTHSLTHSLTHLLTYSLTHLGVCFTGHSLGGAVASGIFFKYHMYVPNPLDTLVVTLGSPQMLKKNMPTKVSWHPGTALAYSATNSLTHSLTHLLTSSRRTWS